LIEGAIVEVAGPLRVARGRSDARSEFPQVAELLEDAAEDLLAHLHFPREHRRRLHSTNPLECPHKEIKRRTRVVGIFPTKELLAQIA
jgi:transposase-like protein